MVEVTWTKGSPDQKTSAKSEQTIGERNNYMSDDQFAKDLQWRKIIKLQLSIKVMKSFDSKEKTQSNEKAIKQGISKGKN